MEAFTAYILAYVEFGWKNFYCLDLVATALTLYVMEITSRGQPSKMPLAFSINTVTSVLWFYVAFKTPLVGGIVLNVWGFYCSIRGMIYWYRTKKLMMQAASTIIAP